MSDFKTAVEDYTEALIEHWDAMAVANDHLLTAFDAVINSVIPDGTFTLNEEFITYPAGTQFMIALDTAHVAPVAVDRDGHLEEGSTVIVELRIGSDEYIEVDALELFEALVRSGLCE